MGRFFSHKVKKRVVDFDMFEFFTFLEVGRPIVNAACERQI